MTTDELLALSDEELKALPLDPAMDRFVLISGGNLIPYDDQGRARMLDSAPALVTLIPEDGYLPGEPACVPPVDRRVCVDHVMTVGTLDEHMAHYRERLESAYRQLADLDDDGKPKGVWSDSAGLGPNNAALARDGLGCGASGHVTLPVCSAGSLVQRTERLRAYRKADDRQSYADRDLLLRLLSLWWAHRTGRDASRHATDFVIEAPDDVVDSLIVALQTLKEDDAASHAAREAAMRESEQT